MRDQRKVFLKLLEKDKKLQEIKSKLNDLSEEEIGKLPLPLWQRNMFLTMKRDNQSLERIKDLKVIEQDIWAGTVLDVYISQTEFWLKQSSGKENLVNTGDMVAIDGNNAFWGQVALRSCVNLYQLMTKSTFKGHYSKDEYFTLYRQYINDKNPAVDQVIDLTGNTSSNVEVLSQYGVRIGR